MMCITVNLNVCKNIYCLAYYCYITGYADFLRSELPALASIRPVADVTFADLDKVCLTQLTTEFK